MAPFGDGYRYHVTGLAHDERGYPTQNPAVIASTQRRLHDKIERQRHDIVQFETVDCDDADVVVFAYGIVSSAARQTIRMARAQGIRAGLFRAITLWPFPAEAISALAKQVGRIVVAEMNLGQMVGEVERAARSTKCIETCLKADGETISPEEILTKLTAGRTAHV